jgi:hypothetical protein
MGKPQISPLRFALSKNKLQPPDFEWVAQVAFETWVSSRKYLQASLD